MPAKKTESEPARPWAEIAADAAAKSAELRVAALVADLVRWREIVASIAAGKEPDGAMLNEIGGLAASLALGDGSLADDVKAVADARRADEELAAMRSRRIRWESEGPAIAQEIDNLRARIRELEATRLTGQRLMLQEAERMGRGDKIRTLNPRMFADAATVAKKVIDAQATRAWAPPQGADR